MYVSKLKPKYLLADETLTFWRYLPQNMSVVDGLRVRASDNVIYFTCTGNVQPVSGKDLRMLPEGEQIEGQLSMVIWHDDAEQKPLAGDVVVRDGNYRVVSATEWGAFTRVRLARDDGQVIANG